MRYFMLLLIVSGFYSMKASAPLSNMQTLPSHVNISLHPEEQKIDVKNPEIQAKAALGASLLGALLIALPYVSLLGLLLGIGGLVLGFLNRKKVKKKLFTRLAIWLGVACLLYFTAAVVLVLFV